MWRTQGAYFSSERSEYLNSPVSLYRDSDAASSGVGAGVLSSVAFSSGTGSAHESG